MSVGAVPIVRGSADEADASRQTHLTLMRPIREPLGPSAPVPGAGPATNRNPTGSRDVRSAPAEPDNNAATPRDTRSTRDARANRVPAIAAVIATMLVAVGGYFWWHGHRSDSGQQAVGATRNDAIAGQGQGQGQGHAT